MRESGRLKLDWTNNTTRALSNFPVGNFKLLSNIFHQVVALSTSFRDTSLVLRFNIRVKTAKQRDIGVSTRSLTYSANRFELW